MILIKRNSSEWNYMWSWLEKHPLNEGLEEPTVAYNKDYSESWQYMGSFKQNDKVIHEFRHRAFPKDNQRKYLKLSASNNFTTDDIENEVRIV